MSFHKVDLSPLRSPTPFQSWLNWGTISEVSESRTERLHDHILLLAWKIKPKSWDFKQNKCSEIELFSQMEMYWFCIHFSVLLTFAKHIICFLTLRKSAFTKKMQMRRGFQTALQGKKSKSNSVTSWIFSLTHRNVFH